MNLVMNIWIHFFLVIRLCVHMKEVEHAPGEALELPVGGTSAPLG
jgi:hypothetical protein